MKLHLSLIFVAIMMGSSAYGFPDYYEISNHALAQAEARQRNLPLVWVGGFPELLNEGSPEAGSQGDLEQMAMAALHDQAVIIFFDGRNMAPVPGMVHAEFHKQDDGPLPGGANWDVPKIVFTNPEVTKVLGRVSSTQMRASREAEILGVLNTIHSDPTAMELPKPPPPRPAATDAGDTNESAPSDGYRTRFGKIPLSPQLVDFLNQNRETLKWVAGGLVVFLILLRLMRRNS